MSNSIFVGGGGSNTNFLSGGAQAISILDLSSQASLKNYVIMSNDEGGLTAVPSQSVGTPPGIPGLHAITHLSGASDPISAQDLAASGVLANYLLITNSDSGWTTIHSSTFVGAGNGPHATTHHSGGSDPIDAQYLRANTIPINHLLITHNSGGFKTLVSSSLGFVINSDLSPFSSSVTSSVDKLLTMSSSYNVISASYKAISASYNTLSATYYPVSASYNTISSSYLTISASYNTISSSFIGFSASHAVRHLSGAADPIDAQLLRADGVDINRLLLSDGLGGWTTVASQSVGTPPGAPAAHASTHISGGSDPIDIQLLRSDGQDATTIPIANGTGGMLMKSLLQLDIITNTELNPFSASITASVDKLLAISSSYNILSATYYPVSASYNTISASYKALSASYEVISASYRPFSASYNTLSATYYPISASYNIISSSYMAISASYNTISASYISVSGAFRNFSASHASRHLSGGADPIDAQSLRGNALTVNRLLMSDGLGGWTTVASQSVGAPAGAPGPHATTHHSGGLDPVDAQYLRADGLGANLLLMTHATGGFTTITTSSIEANPFFVYFHADAGADVALTNQPLAVNFFATSNRHLKRVDLSQYNFVKFEMIKGATAGAAAATGSLRWSKTFPAAITQMTQSIADDGVSGQKGAYVHFNFASAFTGTEWMPLSSAVKQEGFVGIRTMGGDGVLDPAVGSIWALFKK